MNVPLRGAEPGELGNESPKFREENRKSITKINSNNNQNHCSLLLLLLALKPYERTVTQPSRM